MRVYSKSMSDPILALVLNEFTWGMCAKKTRGLTMKSWAAQHLEIWKRRLIHQRKLTSNCQWGGKSGLWYPGNQAKKGFQGEDGQPVER